MLTLSSPTNDPLEAFALVQQAEAAIRQAQRRYEELVDSLEAIVWRADAGSFRTSYVSKRAESILGYPITQWLCEPAFWEAHLHPEDRLKAVASYRRATHDKRHHALEYRMVAADGREVWFHDSIHAVVEDGTLKEMIGVMVDITERKRAERSLKEMTGRLISAQEEERSRIARELHDDFNQRLALLSIGLERLELTAETDATHPSHIPSHIGDLRRLTREIASDVHRLSHQLHPAKLEHLGLVAAIKGLCRELSEQYGADIDFLYRDVPASITKESALCLFRVAQEALSNTIKHSGVRKGRLELFGDRGILHLCISDGGAGFDSEVVSAKGHLGLISMQERVRAAGGTIAVESRPLRGTRISVHLAA
jgi:PAS domain S-box-containing protein